MNIQIIQARLDSYSCRTMAEEEHAIREITQEVILSALGRTDFFKFAVFHGGTCLRIFHGLNRFSEDLDFCLREKSAVFELAPFLQVIAEEMRAYGFEPQIQDRQKVDTIVRKAFVKDDSIGKVLQFHFMDTDRTMRTIKVKLEVDTNPPEGGQSEMRYLDFPFVSSAVVHDLPSLFAGKIHALLCRGFLKGRDWYDFIWYTSHKTAINTNLLSAALRQTGPYAGQEVDATPAWCREELRRKIDNIDWPAAAKEVAPFVHQQERPSLRLWGRELFQAQLNKIPSR